MVDLVWGNGEESCSGVDINSQTRHFMRWGSHLVLVDWEPQGADEIVERSEGVCCSIWHRDPNDVIQVGTRPVVL